MNSSPSRRTRLLAGAVSGLIALAGLLGAAAPASASNGSDDGPDRLKYVSLGDSYAAGQGGGAYLTVPCLQTANSYPRQLAASKIVKLKADASCAFATSTDVRATQLGRLNKGIDLVTVTVGGNDLNVIGVVAACQPDPNTLACAQALVAAQTTLASPAFGASLVQTFAAITAKAPRAQVIVTGYPHLFGAAFEADPVAQIVNDATDGLNATIAGAVAGRCGDRRRHHVRTGRLLRSRDR